MTELRDALQKAFDDAENDDASQGNEKLDAQTQDQDNDAANKENATDSANSENKDDASSDAKADKSDKADKEDKADKNAGEDKNAGADKEDAQKQEQKNDDSAEKHDKSSIKPPAAWTVAAKALFRELPEAARKEILKRETDYAKGIQQHAEAAKGYDRLMNEIRPYDAMIRSVNSTPEGMIRDLLKTSYMLRTGTPQERGSLIMQLVQSFGADISPFLGNTGYNNDEADSNQQVQQQIQQQVNQLVSPYVERMKAFEQQQTSMLGQQENQALNETKSQIEAFQNATAEDGSPKHMYFENVRNTMATMIRNGDAQNLEQAYEMACWANPEVRAALIASQQKAAEAQRLEEAKRKAKDAKKSSFNVDGQGGTGLSGSEKLSLRDELEQRFNAASGGRL